MKTKESVLQDVKVELENCLKFIKETLESGKVSVKDLNHPDMKAIDWIHDACHTLMLPQGGRGPIKSMNEKRKEDI